jgi:replicative DNA helicase
MRPSPRRSWPATHAATRTMSRIYSIARRAATAGAVGMVVIDYIQLVAAEETRGVPRHEQVAAMSRACKRLAKELGVAVVVGSQLNRECEGRADKRPLLSDLRESGSIEQDADVVLLLHRPDYYDSAATPGLVDLIVAKNRSGATANIKLRFHKDQMRFEDWDAIPDDF